MWYIKWKSTWSSDGTTDRIGRGSTVHRNSLTHDSSPTKFHIHTPYKRLLQQVPGIDGIDSVYRILRN
jgi:hypothetical protein